MNPAIPFPQNHIPIVGQLFSIKGWFPTVHLICQLRGEGTDLGRRHAGRTVVLDRSDRVAALTRWAHAQNAQARINMAVLVQPPPGQPT